MKVKYLFSVIALTFLLGAACQKTTTDTNDFSNTSANVQEKVCQGAVECFDQCTQSSDVETCYFDILAEQSVDFCSQVKQSVLCGDFFKWQESITDNDCSLITTEIWKNLCHDSFIDTQKAFDDADFDGDGLTNKEEMILGTNFRKADTDGDGYTDYEEVQAGFDPLTPAQK